jgi:hypothetical protein
MLSNLQDFRFAVLAANYYTHNRSKWSRLSFDPVHNPKSNADETSIIRMMSLHVRSGELALVLCDI